jgi:hypothetical protein
MNLQYVLVRMLPDAWQIQMTPNVLMNWRATGGNTLTFPIGIGVGKTFQIHPGLPPISTALEFQWMAAHPDGFGQRFNIRFIFKPVLPNLVKKPIFESPRLPDQYFEEVQSLFGPAHKNLSIPELSARWRCWLIIATENPSMQCSCTEL